MVIIDHEFLIFLRWIRRFGYNWTSVRSRI